MPRRSTTSSHVGTPLIEGWPPRWLTKVPPADIERGDGSLLTDFGEALCRVTKDSIGGRAGELLILRPWQRELLAHLLARRADGRYRHRQALVGVARKNGKSGLGGVVGLGGLVLGPQGGEVYSCAADKEQARIVFGVAREMVRQDPELSQILKPYRDVIEFPKTGSVYRVLSAEAFTKEGLNPHLVVFDEVHAQPNRELWDVMALAMGARPEPLMVGITTAGVRTDTTGQDSLCYGLYQHGRRVAAGEVEDPSFFMAWWEPKREDADHRDPATWAEANPGLGDLVAVEDFESTISRTPESEFRTKRCNQWVATQTAWFPTGLWESREDRSQSIPDGSSVVLSFDGSFSGDSTGLTVHTAGRPSHIDVVDLWERPAGAVDWRVDPDEVETVLRAAFERWQVRYCVYDPRIWQQLMERLKAEGYPMEAMPQGQAMVAAAQRFFEDATREAFTHSGDPRLTRHLANAVVKPSPQGPRVQKETPNSPRKIDLAICAVMGHAYASEIPEEAVVPWIFVE